MAATNVQAFSGDVEISSNLAVDTNILFVDSVGDKVGIGTTNPSTALEIYGQGKDLAFKYDTGISRRSEANRDAYYSAIENSIKRVGDRNVFDGSPFTPDTTHEITMGFSDTYTQYNQNDEYYPSYNEMRFKLWSPTNSTDGTLTDVMTLRGDGNVGIGLTSPTAPLSVKAVGSTTLSGEDPSTNGIYVYNTTNSANEDATITMRTAGSSAGDPKLSWDIAGETGFTLGMDNSDSNKMKLCGNWYDLNQGQFMEIDRLGNTIFDVGHNGGTILTGLYNYVDTQSLIVAPGVQGGVGIVTIDTTYEPPPGVAGDVIAKFVNTTGGEAPLFPIFPGLTCSTGDVFTFGVWALASQTVQLEFFVNPGGFGSAPFAFNVVGDGNWHFYQVSVTVAAGATNTAAFFRVDNNSTGTTVYLTGASIRKNPTPGYLLPYTPRYSPISGKGPVFNTRNLVAKEAAIKTLTGNVGIGTTNPIGKVNVYQGANVSFSGPAAVLSDPAPSLVLSSSTAKWAFLINENNDLIFTSHNSLSGNYVGVTGYVLEGAYDARMNDFTGQHRCFLAGVKASEIVNKTGLIVCANKNQYTMISNKTLTGQEAIDISESIPNVSISHKAYDKTCFGVISDVEDPEKREDVYGIWGCPFPKENGDDRVYINSVGEGAIWVTNINGPLESGDYITTSNVAGYGQKQDSEFLANYTVAKITMDCDFNPVTQPIQKIKKELGDVNYWVKTTYVSVSEEEFSNLNEENRITKTETVYTNEDGEVSTAVYSNLESNVQSTYSELTRIVYQKIIKEESKTEQEGWELEVRQELVNVLDEHGQIQWEDDPSGATEKAYKIRYLDANGVETDEANAVHKAAFVGCTYHCG